MAGAVCSLATGPIINPADVFVRNESDGAALADACRLYRRKKASTNINPANKRSRKLLIFAIIGITWNVG